MTNLELLGWAQQAKVRARQGGSMHALWDLIQDAEALASGNPTLADDWAIRRMIEEDKKQHGETP